MPADPDLTGSVRRRARALWDVPPDVLVAAPARIDIVGNHIDYNGGDVITAAIDRWVALAARRRDDGVLRASVSDVGAGIAEFSIEKARAFDLRAGGIERSWSDYAQAAVAAAHAAGIPCEGIDMYSRGAIPLGAGMGSASALLVAAIGAIACLAGVNPSKLEIARAGLDAGLRMDLPVGPLDHAISAIGGLLRFNTDEARVRPLPANLGDSMFALCDSGVRHTLGTLRYQTRVNECREALGLLQRAGMPISELAHLPPDDLDAAAGALPAPLGDRVRHVVEEQQRSLAAEAAIEAGDCATLGALMNESGVSSATLFDISHPTVERIVAIARETPGVHGARMMGAGDGGIAVALIEREALPLLQRNLSGALVSPCRVARGMTRVE